MKDYDTRVKVIRKRVINAADREETGNLLTYDRMPDAENRLELQNSRKTFL